MIRFNEVTKKYGDAESVLDAISFTIERGSFVYLVGPTGSGKTTIFRLIIRDLVPTTGEINIGEWDLVHLSHSKIPQLRRKVGVVFQDLKLLVDRTVIENVMLPLQLSGGNDKEAKQRAEEILTEVGLGSKIDQFPQQLSGGERQRVAIARALIFNPEIILADEPTGNLDSQTSFQILDLLKSINKRGTTVFMATHNDRIIEKTGDRVIIIEHGKLIGDKKSTAKKEHSVEDKKENKEESEEKKNTKSEKTHDKEKEEKLKDTGEKIKLESLAKK